MPLVTNASPKPYLNRLVLLLLLSSFSQVSSLSVSQTHEEEACLAPTNVDPTSFGAQHLALGVEAFRELDDRSASRHLDIALYCLRNEDKENARRDYARALQKLGRVRIYQGRYQDAFDLTAEALAVAERLYPRTMYSNGHEFVIVAQNSHAYALFYIDRHSEAVALSRAALRSARSVFSSQDPQLADVLQTAGYLASSSGQTGVGSDTAIRLLEEAVAIRNRINQRQPTEENFAEIATAVTVLGDIHSSLTHHQIASKYYRRALEIYQDIYETNRYPKSHPKLAESYTNLGWVHGEIGDDRLMRKYYEAALPHYEILYGDEKFPEGHPELAIAYSNVGFAFRSQGYYRTAQNYYEKALSIQRRVYPLDRYPLGHNDLATTLNNIGELLLRRGEVRKADPYYDEAANIRSRLFDRQRYPSGDPRLLRALFHKGQRAFERADYRLALTVYLQAIKMASELYPNRIGNHLHGDLIQAKHGYTRVLMKLGRSEEALIVAREVVRERNEQFKDRRNTKGQFELAMAITTLAEAYARLGRKDASSSQRRLAVEVYQKAYNKKDYPEGHRELAKGLGRNAFVALLTGDASDALTLSRQALAMSQQEANQLYSAYSLTESLIFSDLARDLADVLLSASAARGDTDLAYRSIWNSRGSVLRIQRVRNELTASRQGTELRKALVEKKRKLANLYYTWVGKSGAELRRTAIRRITDEKEELEGRLATTVPVTRQNALEIEGPSALLTALDDKTAVIDIVPFNRLIPNRSSQGQYDMKRSREYAVFLLVKSEPIRRIDISGAEAVDGLVRAWHREILARVIGQAGEKLAQKIWKPIAAFLTEDITTLIVAADGGLSRVPWAALPQPDGTPLLKKYAIALTPAPSMLLEGNESVGLVQSGKTVFLGIGDIDYGGSIRQEDGEMPIIARSATDSRMMWMNLPYASEELVRVRFHAENAGVRIKEGVAAQPRPILDVLPSVHWLHFATHGFFADREFQEMFQLDQSVFGEEQQSSQSRFGLGELRNPLVLSGLVLGGANIIPAVNSKGVPTQDVGYLTAEEIANLSLSKLNLVVLSACETGLGEVTTGQGVLSLRQAFHQAGAISVLASLWKVEDLATAVLMDRFYKELWENNQHPVVAYRVAALALYQNPGIIAPSTLRGVKPVTKEVTTRTRAPVAQWAGFTPSITRLPNQRFH